MDRDTHTYKLCSKCNEVKTLSDFPKDRNKSGGVSCWCRVCHSAKAKESHVRQKAQIAQQPVHVPESRACAKCGETKPASEFRKNALRGLSHWCKECLKARNKEILSNRRYHLKQYGITLTEYHHLLEIQGNRCAICKEVPTDKQGFVLDHDHSTGKFRGILCNRCNVRLGLLENNMRNNLPETFVLEATAYLNDHPSDNLKKGA